MSNFIHLHVHTEYSLLDGACRIPQAVARAKELGQHSLAITDHGVMYGVIDFYKECKKQGIHPVIGCEVYVAPRSRFDKQHKIDSSPYHLVLLCENNIGYQNLIKLVSLAYIDGFYNKPRIDRKLLEEYHEGLIALSACLAGEIPRALARGDYAGAKETALWYKNLFGENNYFLELQNHGISEQKKILPMLLKLSSETGIGMVATNDCHYIEKADSKVQNVLIHIQTNRTLAEGSGMEFETDEFYMKSEKEMRQLFQNYDGAINNSGKIAERCQVEFVFGQTKLPYFEAPEGEENNSWFRARCFSGLRRLYGENPAAEVTARLEYELSVIISMGYVDYYLIVSDFIDYARRSDIPVGPGRGSGAGSLAAYCIGITGIDPIRYNLLFERFLNPERVSMPDFDIDFCYERRQDVIDYVVKKYGSDHVAQIITFGTMAARGAIRDVGRALGVSYASCDAIAKSIPFDHGMTISKAKQSSKEFRELYEQSEENKELIDMAEKLEGMPRHASTHAAGVVITRDPADSYVPLQKNDQSIVTQFPMGTLEELGLLKMDFLGLRTLTVINDAGKMIRSDENPNFDIEKIPLDDKSVFKMLSKGQTGGVFQFESGGMRSVLIQLRPEHMEDLIAVISLYRPGPMDSIPTYIRGRHNPGTVTYKTPALRPILEVTYGCIVYQEQVMQICRELAGYSYGRADLVRRAMSKKKHDVMERERKAFVFGARREDGRVECAGAVANGITETAANEIFDEMSAFASYAFNKSHAAAYALVAYQTAFLRCHYPKQFMAALLTSVLGVTDKVTEYIGEAQKLGISVLPPDVQESDLGFTVRDGKIRFGLLAVKNIGRGLINQLIAERANAPFDDFLNFLERMQGKELNRRAVESLIQCGAMDRFGYNRAQMLRGYNPLMDSVEGTHRSNVEGQLNLFGGIQAQSGYKMPDVAEMPRLELLSYEKEITGLYITGHPLEEYSAQLERISGLTDINKILADKQGDGKRVQIAGIIAAKNLKTTKSNATMAFIYIEDKTSVIEVIVFPKAFDEFSSFLSVGNVVLVRGRVKSSEEETPQMICEQILSLEAAGSHRKSPVEQKSSSNSPPPRSGQKLFLKFRAKLCPEVESSINLLKGYHGDIPVCFYYADTAEYFRCPASYSITPTDDLMIQLANLLGADNVVLK